MKESEIGGWGRGNEKLLDCLSLFVYLYYYHYSDTLVYLYLVLRVTVRKLVADAKANRLAI